MDSNSSSNASSPPALQQSSPEVSCRFTQPTMSVSIVSSVLYILFLLPLSVLILHLGLRRRRGPSPMSHSDVFTCHLAAMELGGVAGYFVQLCATSMRDEAVVRTGGLLVSLAWYGETYFHVLTCLERQLAVVRPVTYRGLKGVRGARLRNAAVGAVWLLCAAHVGVMSVPQYSIVDFCVVVVALTAASYCSLRVLLALVGPAPGEVGGATGRRANRRAFHYIAAILGALLMRFSGDMAWAIASMLELDQVCVILAFEVWYHLPSGLVLPVLFLRGREN